MHVGLDSLRPNKFILTKSIKKHNREYLYNMRRRIYLLFTCLFLSVKLFAQNSNVVIFHIHSTHTAFPDSGRLKGRLYDSVLYTNAEHYRDSTVLIIAPKNLDAKKKVDMIFWFHGWRNNVDSTASFYQLTRQFIASKRNAVLVLPEAAKNSPDSYGGKLEKPGVFKALVNDVLDSLKARKMIGKDCTYGNILLGGHSGGGRVIGKIVANGGMEISEVMLFDAMYSETETFMSWMATNPQHRLIDMYTDVGYGPDAESKRMAGLLLQQQVPFLQAEETALTADQLKANRLVIVHTKSQHNDIICNPDNFELYLVNSPFLTVLP
jgi:hypothetical protein